MSDFCELLLLSFLLPKSISTKFSYKKHLLYHECEYVFLPIFLLIPPPFNGCVVCIHVTCVMWKTRFPSSVRKLLFGLFAHVLK